MNVPTETAMQTVRRMLPAMQRFHQPMRNEEGREVCSWCDTYWPCVHHGFLVGVGVALDDLDHATQAGDRPVVSATDVLGIAADVPRDDWGDRNW